MTWSLREEFPPSCEMATRPWVGCTTVRLGPSCKWFSSKKWRGFSHPVGACAARDASICRTSGQTRERNTLLPCTWPRGQTHHFPIDRHSICSMKGWAGNSLKSSLPWQSYTGRNELLLETSVPTPTFLLLLSWGHLHLNLGIIVSPVLCWMFWTEIGEKQTLEDQKNTFKSRQSLP